jgi:V/A-type H+/Na+-transporting ATPase subunit D
VSKVRFTKTELKLQKDNLKRFSRYLPTLELKKHQLLAEIRRIQSAIERLENEMLRAESDILPWADVFSSYDAFSDLVRVRDVRISEGNIAGITIPVLDEVVFDKADYDLFETPLWVDRALPPVLAQIRRRAEHRFAAEQQAILREELRTTIQRIKLFENVKIPEAKENIRMIQIFLGDLRTAEVVRGKIAKAKILRKKRLAGVS